MTTPAYSFTAELWDYKGQGSWHFLTLPSDLADDIKARVAGRAKGFGSVPVAVRIGDTAWETSLFPDMGSDSYMLPVKKAVREAEGLVLGDMAEVELTLRV